jgi:hypothetical protein
LKKACRGQGGGQHVSLFVVDVVSLLFVSSLWARRRWRRLAHFQYLARRFAQQHDDAVVSVDKGVLHGSSCVSPLVTKSSPVKASNFLRHGVIKVWSNGRVQGQRSYMVHNTKQSVKTGGRPIHLAVHHHTVNGNESPSSSITMQGGASWKSSSTKPNMMII